MRSTLTFFSVCFALVACNTTSVPPDTSFIGNEDGGHDAATPGDDSGSDAGHDAASTVADVGVDAPATPDAGCSGVLLTVLDDSSWCDITVNGGTAFGGAAETVCVPANSNVALVETAHSGFILGHWFGTSGDTGTGETGTVSGTMSTAHVMTGAAGTTTCVSTCCPFPAGTGCPATDTCP